VRARVEAALDMCGYRPADALAAPRRIGAGAWHDAYLVRLRDGRRLVVRLRKGTIYGQREAYDERGLRSDYAGVGAYYQAANEGCPGVCPSDYGYAISPDLSCTVESYLGPSLSLGRLIPERAFAIGEAAGRAIRAIHALRPPWPGWGELIWMPDGLRGEDIRPSVEIRRTEAEGRRAGLARLRAAGQRLDDAVIGAALERARALR
jgi:hypothetical protein